MRASGSTAAFGHLTQFQLEPELDVRRTVQGPDTARTSLEKRTGPRAAAPTEVSFGRFRLLPAHFPAPTVGKIVRRGRAYWYEFE